MRPSKEFYIYLCNCLLFIPTHLYCTSDDRQHHHPLENAKYDHLNHIPTTKTRNNASLTQQLGEKPYWIYCQILDKPGRFEPHSKNWGCHKLQANTIEPSCDHEATKEGWQRFSNSTRVHCASSTLTVAIRTSTAVASPASSGVPLPSLLYLFSNLDVIGHIGVVLSQPKIMQLSRGKNGGKYRVECPLGRELWQ